MKESDRAVPFFRGKVKFFQPQKHRISVDLIVFLSKLKGIKRSSKVADLGAGFGFLSVVVAKKFGCTVHALERDQDMLRLLKENVKLNGVEDRVFPVPGDVRKIEEVFKRGEFDAVLTNPPFYPIEYGVKGRDAHFEEDTTLRDFIRASSYLLRDGGYLNLILPSFRLYEAFLLMRDENLPPRFLSIVYPKLSKEGRLSIVSSIRNRPGPLRVEKAVVINREDGDYTEEVRSLLEGFL